MCYKILLTLLLLCSACGTPAAIAKTSDGGHDANSYAIRFEAAENAYVVTVWEPEGKSVLRVPEEHSLSFPQDAYDCHRLLLAATHVEFVKPDVVDLWFPLDDESERCHTDNIAELRPRIKWVRTGH